MEKALHKEIGLTVYCARAGDHNERAMPGAISVGMALSESLGIPSTIIGTPEPALNTDWQTELASAKTALNELARHIDLLFENGIVPLCALSRCAVSLATLPVLMKHRPDACVVWMDAHADLNTPQTSPTGYLGGMALSGPAGLWDSGLGNGLPMENILLVGARDLDPAEQALVDTGKVRLIPPGPDLAARLRSVIDGRPLYVHLDCDVLEPGIVPTNYRVPGGFTLKYLDAVCELLAENELVGLEIAEFENAWPENNAPALPGPLLEALAPILERLGLP